MNKCDFPINRMKLWQSSVLNLVFVTFGLFSMTTALAASIAGVYEEPKGAQIVLVAIDGGGYKMTSNHNKLKAESGHDWSGAGVMHNGKYIGVMKFKDDDTKYLGLAGYCEGETVISSKTCITLTCLPLKDKLSFGTQFNGAKYCKIDSTKDN